MPYAPLPSLVPRNTAALNAARCNAGCPLYGNDLVTLLEGIAHPSSRALNPDLIQVCSQAAGTNTELDDNGGGDGGDVFSVHAPTSVQQETTRLWCDVLLVMDSPLQTLFGCVRPWPANTFCWDLLYKLTQRIKQSGTKLMAYLCRIHSDKSRARAHPYKGSTSVMLLN
eukprot:1158665-Pelagomonas_calceolata.AAC.3